LSSRNEKDLEGIAVLCNSFVSIMSANGHP
jgi:hypothetical protein